MKKRLIATMMVACLAVTGLAGCGSNKSEETAKTNVEVPTESFGDTNIEELINVIKKLAEQNLFPNAKSITATSKVDKEVKAQSIDDVENVKMKALMEKYLGKTEEENITE